jgi:hypothetical protein
MNKSILDSSKFRFSLDFSKFRFRIGDIVRWGLYDCEIVGYYFSEGFNNFNKNYGYVILRPDDEGHNGFVYGFDEYGNNLAPNPTNNSWYVYEYEVESTLINIQEEKNLKKNENEIKLQRTKAVISRGTVPAGYRIRSKVHKTAISIQPLSYTEITRGS